MAWFKRSSLDDTLDVFACHGLGGITGAVLTGVFASKAVNPGGADGLLFGDPGPLVAQLAGSTGSPTIGQPIGRYGTRVRDTGADFYKG